MSTAGSPDPSLATSLPRVGGSLKRVTAVAAAVVALVNSVIYLIGEALGAFPDSVLIPSMTGERPFGFGDVLMGSVLPIVAGGALLAWLNRRRSDPWRPFRTIAIIVLVLSLPSPFTLKDAPGDMVAMLLLMHVATAAVGLPLLSRFDDIVASGGRS